MKHLDGIYVDQIPEVQSLKENAKYIVEKNSTLFLDRFISFNAYDSVVLTNDTLTLTKGDEVTTYTVTRDSQNRITAVTASE